MKLFSGKNEEIESNEYIASHSDFKLKTIKTKIELINDNQATNKIFNSLKSI